MTPKRALLVVPPFYRLMGARNNWIHLGMSYIAGVLEQEGHEAKVYNADYVCGGYDIDQEDCFGNYPQYVKAVNDPRAPIWEEAGAKIREYEPDVVGITLVVSATLRSAVRIAEDVKRWRKGVQVVVGGPHATIMPLQTLAVPEFDYVVRGEGERTMAELMSGRDPSKIDGISFRVSGVPGSFGVREFIEDLDALPFPRKEQYLVPFEDLPNEFGVVNTSRGCPYRCGFCASHKIWLRKVRYRSVENVVDELRFRKEEYGVRMFYFSDDSFNLNVARGKELCRRIIAEGLDIGYYCEMNVKPLDAELLDLMKRSGCVRLKFGIESGSDRILRLMQKNATAADNERACRLAREAGIPFSIYTMVGYVTETRDEIEATYRLARDSGAKYVAVTVVTPQAGTDLWGQSKAFGFPVSEDALESRYHQMFSPLINENVNEALIRRFLALNRKHVDVPPYEMRLKGLQDGRAD